MLRAVCGWKLLRLFPLELSIIILFVILSLDELLIPYFVTFSGTFPRRM